ncbi:hypothetical protein PTKIN_Ptkin04bG0127600 [Pterospermum kingtungense]
MHLGGTFVEDRGNVSYVGNEVVEWEIDPDIVSYHTLCDMVKELGFREVNRLFYMKPGGTFPDGLLNCYDNYSFIEMINDMNRVGQIHVYVDHAVDIPIAKPIFPSLTTGVSVNLGAVDHDCEIVNVGDVNSGERVDLADSNEVQGVNKVQEVNTGEMVEIGVLNERERVEATYVNGAELNVEKDRHWAINEEQTTIGGESLNDEKVGESLNDREVGESLNERVDYTNLMNVRVVEVGAYGDNDGLEEDADMENDEDPFKDFLWVSNNEDEEIQEIKANYQKYKDEKGKRKVRANDIPTEVDFEGLVKEIKKRRAEYKKSKIGEGSGVGQDIEDDADEHYLGLSDRGTYETDFDGNSRTRASYKEKRCPFVIYAGVDNSDGFFKIKTLKEQHECFIPFTNTRASYKVIVDHFIPKLRILPDLKLHEMVELAKEEKNVNVSLTVCRRAKIRAMEMIRGRYHYEFKRLYDYAAALREADPKANVELMVVRPTPQHKPRFLRFYVSFSALQDRFVKYCRPIVYLDGSFLKGQLKGELLVALGKDANNQMYHTAWAIVEGLCDDVKEVTPKAEHRYYARHFFANWKKGNKGEDLHIQFWNCCKATTIADFKNQAKALGEIKGSALEDLLKKNPKHWCKAFFSTISLSDAVDNNIAEAFNAKIIHARHMSIISMFEEIRHYVMNRIVQQQKVCANWKTVFCPRICEIIEHNKEISSFCHVVWNRAIGYEVACRDERFIVNVNGRRCACRRWDLTGIPCAHAITVILYRKEKVEQYVAPCYKKEVFDDSYNCVLFPLTGDKIWPDTQLREIDPPIPRKTCPLKKNGQSTEGCDAQNQGNESVQQFVSVTQPIPVSWPEQTPLPPVQHQ